MISEVGGVVGSTIGTTLSAAKDLGSISLQLSYLYSLDPWKGLATGEGLKHPGVGWFAGRMLGQTIAGSQKRGLRAGIGKFFAGTTVTSLGFKPDIFSGGAAEEIYTTSAIRRAKIVRGIGYTGGILVGASLAATLIPIAYSAGKGLVSAAQMMNSPFARMNSLDWGNELASSFMTGQASTERQRAIRVMEQAGLSGRGYMGQEARSLHR